MAAHPAVRRRRATAACCAASAGYGQGAERTAAEMRITVHGRMVIQARDVRVAKRLRRANPMHAIGSHVELIPVIDD
jgi:hypothetical protein